MKSSDWLWRLTCLSLSLFQPQRKHLMKLYDIYAEYIQEKITLEEAAEKLNLSETDLKFRITRYGKKLPIVLKTLDRIRDDEITRDQACNILKISPRQVNNLMLTWQAPRPLKQYLIDKAVSVVKWEIRKKYAVEFIAGTCTIEEAAENSEVSERQIRRWVIDLLKRHFQMTFKDLKEVTLARRRRLADEIEEAEGLEVSKINVLNEVSRGERAIEDVALERVLAKRSNRRPPIVRRKASE